jgi:ParB family chromosome partitioning protein
MVPRSHAVLESVVQSMEAVGQLVPIIVAADGNVLLDGATRLEAAKRLGLPFVTAVKVKDIDALGQIVLRIVSNADAYRAQFTVLEATALSNRYRALLAEQAARNKSLNGKRQMAALNMEGSGVPNLGTPEEIDSVGDVAKAAATFVPYGHETIRKVNTIQALATDESQPETVRAAAQKALAGIEKTNTVDGHYRRVQEALADAEFVARVNLEIESEPDLSKPWRDLDVATNAAEKLLKIVPDQVVSWGRTANDMHIPYVGRLAAVREWIDDYERACRDGGGQ